MDRLIEKNNVSSRRCTNALWKYYNQGRIPVIPDIKYKSPGEGELLQGRDPVQYALALQEAGAPVISVVTETDHFGGSLSMLSQIAGAVSVPVICKDFIKSREQLMECASHGAAGVLLMASIMDRAQLEYLIHEALELGLEPLVETHQESEINYVMELPISFLGINNRNILEWETDNGTVKTTEGLACMVNTDVFLLSESSITDKKDVRAAVNVGAHGVLVGTAILKARNPIEMFHNLSISR
ncbi:MAG TPA: indole-3-glycerol-phosphate synthase [Mobilitalea sp.]|nr:indole-3-glycerol-phosphate synthase [Mobilitalea sp.]